MQKIQTDSTALREKWLLAQTGIQTNTTTVHGFSEKVLTEGGVYNGVWLECAPFEGWVYASQNLDVARANHDIFFALQKEDGQLPCFVLEDRVSYSQIQMVVPIARTALALALVLECETFLRGAYTACAAWDAWLLRHRNTLGTGLCEAFCEYDTGHDNSPRWAGLPRTCPDENVNLLPSGFPQLPFLAPDLSATVYGGRKALAAMASLLGLGDASDQWSDSAERLRRKINSKCFSEEDLCYYDRMATGELLRIRGDVLLRVLQEGVPDSKLADQLFSHHILDHRKFWPEYPLPSIALDEPVCEPTKTYNAWSGASQALTALRAPDWFRHYKRDTELRLLMKQWVKAIVNGDRFGQQIDPTTGEIGAPASYTPAMLVLTSFVTRLYGIHQEADGTIDWNAGLPEGAGSFEAEGRAFDGRRLSWKQKAGEAVALVNGVAQFRLLHEGGGCALRMPSNNLDAWELINTMSRTQHFSIALPNGELVWAGSLDSNERMQINSQYRETAVLATR